MRTRVLAIAAAFVLALHSPIAADDAADATAINAIWDAYEAARVSGDAPSAPRRLRRLHGRGTPVPERRTG